MTTLNPQQLEAVEHRDGPLLILAGAGTGKTRVVTERIARLLRSGVAPRNILGVTFTNKAAAEMRSRLAALLGRRSGLDDLTLSTFHSLCVKLIRRDAELLGYSPGFAICDQGEQLALIRKAASTVKYPDMPGPDVLLARIGAFKNRGIGPDECSRRAVEEEENALSAVYRRYQDALRRQNCLDFDDLLLKAVELFERFPHAADHWRGRFHYVMVDEFQDTNQVQFQLVKLIASPRDNLAVVGDDDQSIYAWRGAMAGNILKFRDSYPTAKSVTLEQNYRSTSAILSAANAVIRNNPGRREKNLWSDLANGIPVRLAVHNDQFDEAAAVVSAIRDKRAETGGRARHGDFAVIVRSNAQSRVFEDEFLAARLPFEVIGGQSLYDRKEARDVLSFLAVVAGHNVDNHLLRIINVPPRGIGGKTVDLLAAEARAGGAGLLGLLANPDSVPGLQKAQAEACRRFAGQIEGWRRRLAEQGFPGLVKAILDDSRYEEELGHLYANPLEAASRWNEALEVGDSLVAHAERNADAGGGEADYAARLGAFLQDAMLVSKADGGREKNGPDAVRIITAHSAKGLEYPYVFIPGLEEGLFPHKKALEDGTVEEERRLFYVAMTRARRELTLSHCRNRSSRGKERDAKPSRFLEEIPDDLLVRDAAPSRVEEAVEWLSGLRARLGRGKGSEEAL